MLPPCRQHVDTTFSLILTGNCEATPRQCGPYVEAKWSLCGLNRIFGTKFIYQNILYQSYKAYIFNKQFKYSSHLCIKQQNTQ